MSQSRLELKEIDKSLKVTLDKSIKKISEEGGYNGLMTFGGSSNDAPQKIEAAVQNSTTAIATATVFLRFLVGQGFEADINNEVVGRDSKGRNVTVKKLLRKLAYDLCFHNGFYTHTEWNAEQKVGSYKHIPFKDCRFDKPDDAKFSAKILVYDNWARDSETERYDKSKIDDYSIFTENKATFADQVKVQADGDISKYKGQVYFNFYQDNFFYPLSPFSAAFLDIDTEYYSSIHKNRTVRSGFMKKTLMRISPPETEEAREDFLDDVTSFTGVDGDNFLVIEDNTLDSDGSKTEGAAATFDSVESNVEPDLFVNWEKGTKTNIRLAWSVPQILIEQEVSALGIQSGETMKQVVEYYNGITQDPRDFMSESFEELFKFSANPKLANNKNWKIKEFTLTKEDRGAADSGNSNVSPEVATAQANLRGSVGGVTGLLSIQQGVSAGTTDYDSAVKMLTEIYGFDEQTAKDILGKPKVPKEVEALPEVTE